MICGAATEDGRMDVSLSNTQESDLCARFHA